MLTPDRGYRITAHESIEIGRAQQRPHINMTDRSSFDTDLAVIHGPPLAEEPGLGALTIPGYLREVTTRYTDREALVFYEGGKVVRWSYAELWEHSMKVAR